MPVTLEKIPGQEERVILSMGPQHPSTHGVLRLVLELEGETVVRAKYDIGYLHTGFEKSFESKTYTQGITLTDRMDYLAPLSNNLAFCLAAEKLLDLEIPPKAQWVRVLLTELTRLGSHLVWLGTHAIDIGAMSVFLYCFREREGILRIFEMVSGQRMMTSYFRIGGLALEPPLGWLDRVTKFIDKMPARIDEYEALLTRNPIWLRRTQGVGYLSAEDAVALGVSGPSLRGSGVKWDLRKNQPYSSYEKFDFDVPTRSEGDVYARYRVRMAEMRESLKIVRQAMEGMPEGPIRANAPHIVLPDRDSMKNSIEALIYHFKIVTEGFHPPVGEVYQCVESPRGELGIYMVSDGAPKPFRCHVRAPSFANLQALPKMIEGRLIADAVACIGSIDVILGEIDR
ncbi:MAG: NADH-quinone oxidoreductase subunit D [Acidobacteria bacterium]|nr:MAG: NADH-quinone oxidoreductase subunit D [Acidobacteriota bacterium]PYV23713.1 MAG: NADH-quinone oxidoreductase subunit D [Acidobacteriota bacterium]